MVSRTIVVKAKVSLRGEGRERLCSVSAVQVPDATSPYAAPIKILDPDDNFPDGNYVLILESQPFRIVKRNGKYLSVP